MVDCSPVSFLLPVYSIPEHCGYNGRISAAIFSIVVLPLCLHGWGRLFLRAFRLPGGSTPVMMGLGLAGLLFIGGILNLLGIAYPVAIAGLIGLGLVNGTRRFRFPVRGELNQDAGEKRKAGRWSPGPVAVIAFISGVAGFVVLCLLPSREFNIADDFQKYFSHPVRMLQTGSVAGSPLNGMGSETLGGKAFLDGFFISFFPIGYINGTDAVLGFFLCLLLAAQFAGNHGPRAIATLAALFCLVVVNPQCVNISTLYLGSALIMLSIAITLDGSDEHGPESMPSSVALALVYAAMISLKATYVLFPAFHLPMVMAGIGFSRKRILPAADWAVRTGLWLGLFVSPWMLLHAANFISGWRAPAGESESLLPLLKFPGFFSSQALFYGNSPVHYTWVVCIVLLGALAAGTAAWKINGKFRQDTWMLVGAAIVGAAGYILILFLMPAFIGRQNAVRYFAPFLIGIAPPVLGAIGAQLGACGPDRRIARLGLVLPAGLALMAGAPFLGTVYGRARQAYERGSILAFPDAAASRPYYDYNQTVLGSVIRAKMEKAQRMIPEGETVIAWVKTPFYLNFSRNVVYDVNIAGLAQSWAVIPAAHYLLWQRSSELDEHYVEMAGLPAIKVSRESRQALVFEHGLDVLIKNALKLYEDGDTVLYKLGQPEEAVH